MSDQEDEAEFTENEVNDLNILLQSMSDVHCKEFGHFHLLQSISGDKDIRVTSKHGFGKQALLILRQINSIIKYQYQRGADHSDLLSTLELNFKDALNKSYWPDHEEINSNYGSDGEDYNDWDDINTMQANHDKCIVAQSFARDHDVKQMFVNSIRGKTNQSKAMYGLACLLLSLEPQGVNLVSLNLANNDITCEDVIIACDSFKGLSNLTYLDMSYNCIGSVGANAIFSTLLGDPSCNIRKLNLSNNRSMRSSCCGYYEMKKEKDPLHTLIDVLQHTNRSLVELNLTKTGIRASYSMVNIFVCPLLLDSPNDVFKYVEGRNHCLKVLQVDDAARDNEKAKMIIRGTLDHIISFNKDGPQQALAAKLHCHFEKEKNMELLFTKELDSKEVSKYLEFMGIHGDLFTLMKLVRNFQAQGSLF